MTQKLIKFSPGDIGVLGNGNVVVVQSCDDQSLTAREYQPNLVAGGQPARLKESTYSPLAVSPIDDFSVSWISPARIGFESKSDEDSEILKLAYMLAKLLGPRTRVVVRHQGEGVSLVAIAPSGECAAAAIGLPTPPMSLLKYVLEPSVYVEGETIPTPVKFDKWLISGTLDQNYSDPQMLHTFAQGLFDESSRIYQKYHDYQDWFIRTTAASDMDIFTVLPDVNKIIAWAHRPWLRQPHESNEITSFAEKIRQLHHAEPHAFSDLATSTPASRIAEDFVTDFEDFLDDTGLTPGNISVIKPGEDGSAGGLPIARFKLSCEDADIREATNRYLRTTVGRGFLEVESILSLDPDDMITSAIIDSKSPLVIIDGRGGSGKTTTLMRKAAMDAGLGRRVAFVVASASLKNRLRRLKRQIPSAGRYRKDFDIWSADLIGTSSRPEATRRAADGIGRRGGGYLVAPKTLAKALESKGVGQRNPFLISAHQIVLTVEQKKSDYDTVILDEAQDLWPQHWLLAIALVSQKKASSEVSFPESAQLRIAFDERQNMLHRDSISNALFFEIKKKQLKARINKSKMISAALSFKEAEALASEANTRFFAKEIQVWFRQEAVFRQTSTLAANADRLAQEIEQSNPDLYGQMKLAIAERAVKDRLSEPVRTLTPSSVDELVQSIVSHHRDALDTHTGPLAVALPETVLRWGARQRGIPWFGGELCLRLLAAGLPLVRSANIAIGSVESVRRRAVKLALIGEAFGVRSDDFEVLEGSEETIGFLRVKVDRRSPSLTKGVKYAKVLKRLVENAIWYRASGPGLLLIGEAYSLKGFEFGTLISIPSNASKSNRERDYAVATRPRWALLDVDRKSLRWRASPFTLPAMLIEECIETFGQFPVLRPTFVRSMAEDKHASLGALSRALLQPFKESSQWDRLLSPMIKSLLYIVTPAALKQLATTEAWRSHAPADTTPEEIYGKNGSMNHLFNEPFATRADLQDALVQNHGGGVQMEVIEALAALCGPRLDGDVSQVESPL